MNAIVWLVRILALLLLVRFLLRFVTGVIRGLRGEAGRTQAGGAHAAGELVRDRVCNTALPRSRAVRAVVDGHEEHFCSTACRDKALAAAR